MRLSTRLVLLFLLLALVLAPSLGTLVFFSARRALTEVIAREEENEGAAIALAIDREIYKAMLDVENIAANHHAAASITAPAGADLTASEAELVRESRTSGPWDLVSIAGSDGVVRLSTERRRVGAELGGKEREVFARALRDGFAYSDLVTLPDAPRPTLILAHRITANEGPKQGSIVGCVVARYSWPAAAQILNAADMRARIVNSRGETIAYVGEDLRDRSREMGMEHPLVRRKQPGALVEYSTSEGAMMGTLAVEPGYLRYRGNGWMVIVESPRALVQRPITQLAQRTVVVVLLITALSALLFASVARRLTVPIRELTGTAAAVRGGDLSVRASVSTRDEVGELATTFNEMLSTIDQQIAERRQSEAFLASVLDNIPIAVFVSDVRDSKIVRVNAATAAIAGRAPQEFIGRSASDLFPREAAAIREFEKRAIAAGYLEGEGVFALPHGRRRIRTREILIRTAEGAPRYLLGLSEDVTEEFERKRRQSFRLTVARIVSEHGEAGEVLSLLLDAVRDVFHWAVGLVWVPRRERDVLRVAALSPREGFESIAAASGTAQIARDEGVIGEVWGEGTPRWLENVANEPRYTRARAAAADRLKTAIAVPIAVGTEVLGVIELLDVHERPRDEGFLSFLEEVSTQIGHFLIRVRAEEELRRAKAAADEANRAKSDFLARMSHEIRTPLNGVVGMTSLLSRTPLTREQQEFVRTARSSANLLLSVINGILDFSKIEAGKLTLEEVDFSLREVVIEAIKPLATRADDAGVELIVRIDPGVPDALRGDALRLRQVLINLVGNAVKFTPAGEIVVSAAVEEERESELIMRFSVSDTGIGIPSDRLTSIFSAFEQADASTTRRFGGTGLGLAISERLVEMMGGSIRVESEEGKGSTFHFTVSLKRQEAPATMPPTPTLAGLRVLIVDDNATNRLILQSMLESWRMRVTAAAGGREALAAVGKESFDLVLLDAHMPEVDGFTVAGEMRERGARATTIMMLTSASHPADAKRARAAGIEVSLTKPVTQSDLLDAITRALSGEETAVAQSVPKRVRSPIRRGKRILLAEDNEVNQLVAVGVLEQAGYDVVVANDGREAVDVLERERERIDLVLMDLQMPRLGGLEAIRIIRESERGRGTHVPIVALTAHATREDEERCLAAGADGYVPKPLDEDKLLGTIDCLLEREGAAGEGQAEPFDVAAIRRRYAAMPALLEKLVRVFEESIPKHIDRLREALQKADPEALNRAAHSLRGSVGTFQAVEAMQLAAELERAGKSGDMTGADRLLAQLEGEVTRLLQALGTMHRGKDVEAK